LSGVAKNIKLNKTATSKVKRTAAILRGRQGKRARQLRANMSLLKGGRGGWHVATAGRCVPGNVVDSTMVATGAQAEVVGGGDVARLDFG